MNGLQTFANEEFGAVRSLMIEDMPWFVGRDVATALGYAKPRNAISVHVDDEDKNSALIQGAIQGGTQGNPNMTIINESGLYSLILSSKLPAAKRFKRWVTSEVLPAIRRTGGYGTATQAAEPETVAASGTGDYERRLPPRRVHRRLLQKRALALCAGVPEQGRAFHRLTRADAGRTARPL